MHLEFRALLHAALGRSSFQTVAAQLSDVEVTDAPRGIAAEVSSAVVFEIVALLRRTQTAVPEPTVVAQEIVEALLRLSAAEAPLFTVEIGGGGHINAITTVHFQLLFLRQLFKSQGNCLFQRTPFVVPCLEAGDSGLSEAVMEIDMPLQMERMLRTLGAERAPDIMELCSHAKSQLDCEQGIESDARLMLLAALADSQLDCSSFLRGLQSRENVPWYLTRLLRDTKSFGERVTERSPSTGLELAALPSWKSPASQDAVMQLLRFRRSLALAGELRRPEILMGALLRAGHAFYNLYNRPNIRQLSFIDRPDAQEKVLRLALLKTIAESYHCLFKKGLAMLGMGCE
jgi:hypothetical protein